MSKLLKMIFNRLTIVLLLIALQIAVIVWFVKEAAEYYVFFQILLVIISLIFAYKIFKNNMPSHTKIPLMILLLIFPILGIFLYYFALENRMRKKFILNFKNQTFTLESLYIENKDVKDQLLNDRPD